MPRAPPSKVMSERGVCPEGAQVARGPVRDRDLHPRREVMARDERASVPLALRAACPLPFTGGPG
eukprot:5687177-Lingulodinium_polyedra.AAC.1